MTTDELLADMEANPEAYADTVVPVNDVLVINPETRLIELPESEKLFGVEHDEESERKHFICPRIVGDNIDLSELHLFINFMNANGDADKYPIEDVEVVGDNITFSWVLSEKVTRYKTDKNAKKFLSFLFCAKKTANQKKNDWNTTLCRDAIVLEGLEPGQQIVEDNPDIIQYIIERLDSAQTITPEQIAEAVENYFAENPLTAEDVGARPDTWMPTAKEVGALPDDTQIPEVPDALPNPHALTIKQGNETITYNGYGAVTVTVPGENPMRIEKGSTDTVVELEAGNKYYVFPEMETLTYTIKGEGEVHFFFQSGATPCEVVHPPGVNVGNLTVEANRIYEISVLESCLTYQSWAVS